MKYKVIGLAVSTAVHFALVAAPAVAQNADLTDVSIQKDTGAKEHIDLSGKLRMLSQRIPAAACHYADGIAVDKSSALLENASAEFEKILSGLKFGDAELNLPYPEESRKTLAAIEDVRQLWDPIGEIAQSTVAGQASSENIEFVLTENMPLLESAKALVVRMVAQYSNPTEMLQATSLLIDVAGRQRMLTQKMSKESCIVAGNHDNAEVMKANLAKTMQTFEASLNALRHGMQAAGITPPPSQDIANGLDKVILSWSEVKPMLEAIIAGEEADAETRARKFDLLNTAMSDMNKVVGLYVAYQTHHT